LIKISESLNMEEKFFGWRRAIPTISPKAKDLHDTIGDPCFSGCHDFRIGEDTKIL